MHMMNVHVDIYSQAPPHVVVRVRSRRTCLALPVRSEGRWHELCEAVGPRIF